MASAARRILQVEERARAAVPSNGQRPAERSSAGYGAHTSPAVRKEAKPRVLVASENRLLREALCRMLTRNGDIEVVAGPPEKSLETEDRHAEPGEVLLLSSKGRLAEDLEAIRRIRLASPEALILLIDATGEETNFLQCVRAGIRGYLPREASAEEVVEAVRAIHAGNAICPGKLCAVLFRYLQREASCFPSASAHQRLGLTRREQQIIPLVAEGLTNKEIANRFCLSEQTVKNHLYRMKQKVGAEDRLALVQRCRTEGFMI